MRARVPLTVASATAALVLGVGGAATATPQHVESTSSPVPTDSPSGAPSRAPDGHNGHDMHGTAPDDSHDMHGTAPEEAGAEGHQGENAGGHGATAGSGPSATTRVAVLGTFGALNAAAIGAAWVLRRRDPHAVRFRRRREVR